MLYWFKEEVDPPARLNPNWVANPLTADDWVALFSLTIKDNKASYWVSVDLA